MDRVSRAELIADIARAAASSDDTESILTNALRALARAITFKGGSIAFPQPDGRLAIAVAVGTIDEEARAVRLAPGQGIVGRVFASGTSYRTGDLDAERRVIPATRSAGTNRLIRSFLCVPLTSQGRVFGTLEVDSAEPDAFDEEDQELLEIVGAVLGGVVRLARLVDRERELMAARDHFFTAVAHDLRSPLTVISGQAQRLLARHRDDADTSAIAAIARQSARLERSIAGLLQVARARSGDPVPASRRRLDLAPVVERAARETLGPDAQSRLAMEIAPVEGEFDARRVEHIVTNLIENCAKYAPDGPIEVTLRRQGGEAVLEVSDHGPGVPEAQRERIFHRWDRGDRQDDAGTGLGLYLVRLAAEAHQGSAECLDRDDGRPGARFRVRLSVVSPERPAG